MEPSSEVKTWIDTNEDWFERALVWCAARDGEALAAAGRVVCRDEEGGHVDDFSDTLLGALFAVLRDFKMAAAAVGAEVPPPSPEVMRELLSNSARKGAYLALSEVPAAVAVYQEIMAQDLSSIAWVVKAGFAHWVAKKRTASIFLRTVNDRSWDPDSFLDHVRRMRQHVDASAEDEEASGEFVEGLRNRRNIPRVVISTGLRELDHALGGGLARKDGHLVLAAPSAGKTVFACQIASQAAMAGYRVCFITTEQPIEELQPRILSSRANIPFSELVNGFTLDTINPKYMPAVENVMARLQGRLLFHDWNKSRRTALGGGLQQTIEETARRIGGCDIVVLDWLGQALPVEVRTDPGRKRVFMQETAVAMADVARQYDCATVLFAQVNRKNGTNKRSVSIEDAVENKTLDQPMTAVIGISAMLDEELSGAQSAQDLEAAMAGGRNQWARHQFYYISKARKSSGGYARWFRRFEYQRMEDVN